MNDYMPVVKSMSRQRIHKNTSPTHRPTVSNNSRVTNPDIAAVLLNYNVPVKVNRTSLP